MLSGKTALITGASRGIGKGIATMFAQHGAFIGLNYYQHQSNAEATLKQINGQGVLLQADIAKPQAVQQMVNTLVQQQDTIDIVVLNAGIYKRHAIDELKSDDWQRILDVNLHSCYHIVQQTLPHIPKGGRIIFISSQLAFKGTNHGADYATSKAGMLGFMRSLALELGSRKITVNAIAPGTIDTDIIGHYTKQQRQDRIKQIPLGRLGKPEDIAHACLFLAADLSEYITGETINVNGGLYIH